MPAPPLVVTNAVEVRLLGTAGAQLAINVLHARKSAGLVITQALANTIGSAVKAAWTSRFATLVTASGGLVRVGLRDLTSASQPEFLDTGGTAAGTAVGDTLPAQVAACVTLRTALAGKSFRGRVYFSGFSEAENIAGMNASAAVGTAVVAFLTDVQNTLASNQMTLAVLSRPAYAYTDTRTWQLPAGETQVDITGRGKSRTGGVEPVTLIQNRTSSWESQRRRVNGRGAPPTLLTAVAQQEIVPV